MRNRTFIVVIAVLALLFGIAAIATSGDGGRLTTWLASMHGNGGH